jgi:hypothetical protein
MTYNNKINIIHFSRQNILIVLKLNYTKTTKTRNRTDIGIYNFFSALIFSTTMHFYGKTDFIKL